MVVIVGVVVVAWVEEDGVGDVGYGEAADVVDGVWRTPQGPMLSLELVGVAMGGKGDVVASDGVVAVVWDDDDNDDYEGWWRDGRACGFVCMCVIQW